MLLAHFSTLPEVECLARESHLGWPHIATLGCYNLFFPPAYITCLLSKRMDWKCFEYFWDNRDLLTWPYNLTCTGSVGHFPASAYHELDHHLSLVIKYFKIYIIRMLTCLLVFFSILYCYFWNLNNSMIV